MLSTEQAKAYLDAHQLPGVSSTDLGSFSKKYQALGQAILTPLYGYQQPSALQRYQEAFGSERGTNPWRGGAEAERLAILLFGAARAPYLADVWDLYDRLPYQTSHSRRPFRTQYAEHYTGQKLRQLQQLHHDRLGGLDLVGQLRYATYTGNYNTAGSHVLAVALMGPDRARLRPVVEDIINGEDEIGGVTGNLLKALLLSEQVEDWELVSRLLLAAQQQEGLRQAILEAVDEASLGALRHLTDVLLEHDLTRFSSVVRAVGVWTGLGWDSPRASVVKRTLEIVQQLFAAPERVGELLQSRDNLECYLALWFVGIHDVDEANRLALSLLEGPTDRRVLGLYFMQQTERVNKQVVPWMEAHFGEELEVDGRLIWVVPHDTVVSPALFDRVRAVADALPTDGRVIEGTVFEWLRTQVTPYSLYDFLLQRASADQLQQLGSDLSKLPSNLRESYLRTLFPEHYSYRYGQQTAVTSIDFSDAPWKRDVILQAIGDRNQTVMQNGLNLLPAIGLTEEELPLVAGLLARKGKTLRSGLIGTVLQAQPEWIERLIPLLLESSKVDQRLAGLELLAQLKDASQQSAFVDAQISSYRQREAFSKNERVFLDKFVPARQQAGYANGFGLIDADNLRALRQPELRLKRAEKKGMLGRLLGKGTSDDYLLAHLVDRPRVERELAKLVALLRQHAGHEYQSLVYGEMFDTVLVGQRIRPVMGRPAETPREELLALPLAEVWMDWYNQSGLTEYELYAILHIREEKHTYYQRYAPAFDTHLDRYRLALPAGVFGETDQWGNPLLPVKQLLQYLYDGYVDHPTMAQFVVDLFEDRIARLPEQLRTTVRWKTKYGAEQETHWCDALMDQRPNSTGATLNIHSRLAAEDTLLQLYDLQQWLFACRQLGTYPPASVVALSTSPPVDHPVRVSSTLVLRLAERNRLSADALRLHAVHDSGLFEALERYYHNTDPEVAGLHALSQRAFAPLRQTILDVELERGELTTEVSPLTDKIQVVEGADRLLYTLGRMGKETFNRGYSYGNNYSRKEIFSKLVKRSVPGPTDTPETFAEQARATKIARKRWIEVAMYAPQWAPWIAELIEMPELESAVWWFHAHATDYLNKEKETIVARHSAIDRADLARGAIDIDWFYAVYRAVGKADCKLLHAAAKYISDGNGHRQVKLYSAILLGEVKITETLARIKDKRDKDYVKGLGLVPLSKRRPAKDTLERYELLQRFLAESKQFGNQRQESERQAVEIALDNLARTAGYEDAVRFGWVMEGESTRRLLDDAVVEIDDTRIELYINEVGKADIAVERKGKLLKDVPAKYRKDKRVQSLKEGKTALRKQLSRTRRSLEQAMVAGTVFTAAELAELYRHPIVHVMLDQLVLVAEEGGAAGFFRGDRLEGIDAYVTQLRADDRLRIAHPYDLFHRVVWDLYQKEAFDRKLRQPFKQLFRELYLVTADERETSRHSNRYQGHQIQPKKAVALLRGRGWTVSSDEGLQRVDHARGVVATMYAAADWYTPADVESPTIEQVAFYDRKTYTYLAVDQIDPLLFSEVMRDIDLVVSVAHVGGVDPEASHSTLEMRAALARESARLFKLDNVEVKTRHILIHGTLGDFQVHLGSGVVSKHGLQLNIQAVQSQHRGRVFLPFVDDDPKSAEIITKMRLLARDGELKDPTILAQLAK